MKRWQLALVGLAALAITACKQTNEQPAARVDQAYQPLAQMDTTPSAASDQYTATDPYATDPLVTPSGVAAREGVVVAADDGGVRTHVVEKGDTLYKLARKYYQDQRRWRAIWEANRTRISNPDKLEVGTELIIP